MEILVAGISFKTAPVELREQVFLRPTEREALLSALKIDVHIAEAFVLSTCNRTEIYACVPDGVSAGDLLVDVLFKAKGLALDHPLRASFYVLTGEECVRHLMRVATGLESIVLGEKQILGQVKEAVDLARLMGILDRRLNILTSVAIRAGKKAQHETDIGCGGCSVSWAAVRIAEERFKSWTGRSALIIGAGKMSALTLQQLENKRAGSLFVMNRTLTTAETLADQIGAEAVPFDRLSSILCQVDLCICSASAPHFLIDRTLMEKVMSLRQERELLCIDISTPRNIDPQVGKVKGVTLLTIDDLDKVVKDNSDKRRNAVEQVERLVSEKVSEFYRKLESAPALEGLLSSASSPLWGSFSEASQV